MGRKASQRQVLGGWDGAGWFFSSYVYVYFYPKVLGCVCPTKTWAGISSTHMTKASLYWTFVWTRSLFLCSELCLTYRKCSALGQNWNTSTHTNTHIYVRLLSYIHKTFLKNLHQMSFVFFSKWWLISKQQWVSLKSNPQLGKILWHT